MGFLTVYIKFLTEKVPSCGLLEFLDFSRTKKITMIPKFKTIFALRPSERALACPILLAETQITLRKAIFLGKC
jgi:hypothetical protein